MIVKRHEKELLGWYGSRTRKGGNWRRPVYDTYVQQSRVDNDGETMEIAIALNQFFPDFETRERVLVWADNTDDTVVSLTVDERAALALFRGWGIDTGRIRPNVTMERTEELEWETLPERRKQWTRRLLEGVRG